MDESDSVKPDRKRKLQDQEFVYSVDYEKTRRFKEEWKMQFPWVSRDPAESQRAYCRACDKLLTPKTYNLEAHEKSVTHKRFCKLLENQNFEMPSGEFDNKAGVPKSESHDEVTGTSKPIADSVKGRKFKESWKTTFPWVMKDPAGSEKAFCSFCNKLLNPKTTNVRDHQKTSKHQKLCPSSNDEKSEGPPSSPDPESSSDESDEDEDEEQMLVPDTMTLTEPIEVSPSSMSKKNVERKFQEEWSKTFPWVKEDPRGSGKAYCPLCVKVLVPLADNIDSHQNSVKHKKLTELHLQFPNFQKTSDAAEPGSENPKEIDTPIQFKGQRMFRNEWTEQFSWVKRDPGGTQRAYCSICNTYLEPKMTNIVAHDKSAKHCQLIRELEGDDDYYYGDAHSAENYLNEMLNNSSLDMKGAVSAEDPWMSDFTWAQRDPGGTEMVFCQFCKILVEPGVPNLKNHEKSANHISSSSGSSARKIREEPFDVEASSVVVLHKVDIKAKPSTNSRQPIRGQTRTTLKSEPGLDMFRCLSCPARFTSQRDLFFHLKSHYEPEADDGAIGHDDVVSYDYPAEDNYGEEELQQDLKPEIVMAPPPPKVQKISKTSLCNKYSWLSLSGEGDVQAAFCNLCKIEFKLTEYLIRKHASTPEHKEKSSDPEVIEEEKKKKKLKKSAASANENFKEIMSEQGEIKYECNQCHKHFSRNSLRPHMRIHQDLRPFKCDYCPWAFRQANDLKAHVHSIHLKLLAFQCEICGSNFARKTSLKLHQKIHTGVRDHHCDICFHSFRSRSKMTEHRRIHTGEKPYMCDFCGSSFRIKSDMTRHRANVHMKGTNAAPDSAAQKQRNKRTAPAPDRDPTPSGSSDEDSVVEMGHAPSQQSDDPMTQVGQDLNFDEMPNQQQLVFIGPNEAIFVPKRHR